jgi:SAM-dependent methyltransferase
MTDSATAAGGGQDYSTDVPYLRTFSPDLSPGLLRLVAALNGFAPPPEQGFDYCELGAGNGDTTVALAAANPGARFVGVDVSPEHAAFGSGLASRGGVDNLRFLALDFADLGRSNLPDFDFITANGVLSWVSPAMRRTMIEVAAAKLKPGGLLYVSYNALPGWAAVEPLRRLMIDSAAGAPGSGVERARRALDLATSLSAGGAEYFANNPAAQTMLATMTRMGLPYVVHEYLQPHWHPRYFVDVAREMAESSLHFVGQLPLHLNYRDLALPPALLDLFKGKGMESRIAFESLKDFALNEFFRRDVYIKGERPCSAATTRAYLESTAFGTLVGEGQIEREPRLPHRTLRYEGPLFDALIPALCAGATTVSELALRPELAAAGRDRIRESLMLLVLGGQVIPMARPAVSAPAPAAALYHLPLAYNRMMLGQRLSADNPILLASPAAGTAMVLPQLEAISLRLLTEVPPEQRSAWIRALVARQPLRLRVGDRWIEDADEKARVIADQLEHFRARRLPKLLDLEIVAPGPGAQGA